ncbi:MAG TPA: hypothetical protein VGM62_00160, partial [Chthoniobacterales bacterium]
MTLTLPFLTGYDPPGTSEGTLDPLGLYQIADQLAIRLVPAVRERMQRIRFLTAMAVGALVTEDIEDNPQQRDASPYLVWEWLIVESILRTMDDDPGIWGVPGTLVARRALGQHGYLDARSYLKTPRIFGFYGVYKRLAIHLGLVNVNLGPGPNAEALVDAWARDQGLGGLAGSRSVLQRWSTAVSRCMAEKPPRTRVGWKTDAWIQLANSFAPTGGKAKERRYLRELLHVTGERRLGALPSIWSLQQKFSDDDFQEERLHDDLEKCVPSLGQLLVAIRTYEGFARGLQDAFDVMKAEAAGRDAQGFNVPQIASNAEFKQSVKNLNRRFEATYEALGEVMLNSLSLSNLFSERFGVFAEPMSDGDYALVLCAHHESVQLGKSA